MPSTTVRKPPESLGRTTPQLVELTQRVLFDEVWERPGLSKRDRSLITCAVLVALYRPEQLRFHLNLAQTNGLTRDELAEMITHVAFYAGWPAAVQAAQVADETFNKSP